MCGLAGVLGLPDPGPLVRRMAEALAHRGPDDEGWSELRDAAGAVRGAFGHRRLAIIDPSPAGHQPMASADGRHVVILNGEIYNYRALRAELEREGARFRSGSDTEVLLAGFALRGPAFAARLRGMFAFAVWDRQASQLHLVRDRFGIKPLYVATADGGLLFGSEVRALLASGLLARRLDPDAVSCYLRTGSVPEPLCILEGVRCLPSGAVTPVSLEGERIRVGPSEAYADDWRAPAGEPERDPARAARLVRDALAESVEHHLVSDVPVGVFLSGGMDSSAIVALAAERAGRRLDTFTVVFDDPRLSEAVPARAVAERFDTRHHEISLTAGDFRDALPAAFAAMDQPSMDGLNTYVVSRGVRERGVKVVLSGLGGDELFAGYPSFRRALRLSRLSPLIAPVRGLARRFARGVGGARAGKLELLLRPSSPARAAYEASRTLFTDEQIRRLGSRLTETPAEAPPPGLSLLQQVSWHELRGYMRDTLLKDSDVFSMAHGLELRVPFVDTAVLAASLAVHDDLKLAPGLNKPLLLSAVREKLPPLAWDRPKRGFTLPFEDWMRGPLRAELDAAFRGDRLASFLGEPRAALEVWKAFLARRPGTTWSRPWALYTLARWVQDAGAGAGTAARPEERLASVASP
jgi:asparagine synthase (glutamine-hydrolysing)